jgi:succinate-semialdehyde dehydrogenase / glutarate-semialdehyde dehydrogenase
MSPIMAIQSINPATGEALERFEETSPADIDRALTRSHSAYLDWRRVPFARRAELMRKAAAILREDKNRFARTMALEMGKPIAQGEGEAEKCAWACEYYADQAEAFLAPQARATDGSRSYVRFDPLGPVLAIMPWNFPFWQVFRFAAPALMAGNSGILKHASNVPRCALDIEDVFRRAGFPDGVFTTLLIPNSAVAGIIEDRRVVATTLTGSEQAGMKVAEQSGRSLKKTVLELGGSDPFIVLEDADVEQAARVAVDARLINSGQSCIAAKRFIVVESQFDRFLELFTSEMSRRPMGDPMDRDTAVGPQARTDLRDGLHRQVEASVKQGARTVLGGAVPAGKGAYYPPSILVDTRPGVTAFDEETFGPVAAVSRAKNEGEAIALANTSPYGLGASLWTRDRDRAERLAAEIEAGDVHVNGMVKSDPRLPFGGIKRSGYGRELSDFGIREFVNIKSVWIA